MINDNSKKIGLALSVALGGAYSWYVHAREIKKFANKLFGNSSFLIFGMKSSGKSKLKSCLKKAIEVPDEDAQIKTTYENNNMKYDYIIFIFSLSEYTNNTLYKKRANAYLDFLYRHKNNENIYILGSHYDLVTKEELYNVKTELLSEEKEYAKILDKRYFGINLTNGERIKKLLEKIHSL